MRLLLIPLLALLTSPSLAATNSTPESVSKPLAHITAPPPKGWKVYSETKPSEVALYCTRYGTDWKVSREGSEVIINLKDPGIAWKKSPLTFPFRGGTLRAEYHGEYFEQSSIWWSNADGSINKQIGSDYVYGFEKTPAGTLIFASTIYRVANDGPLPPKINMIKDFGGPYSKEASGNFLVLDNSSIFRFSSLGESKKLFTGDYNGTFTNSVASTSDGTIYVGMRHFVTRLTPVGDGYQEDWLIPEKSAECPLPAECPKDRFPDCKCIKHSDWEIENALKHEKPTAPASNR
jgi:hypothetical protein